MDGCWVLDLGAPTELDNNGNINNVLHHRVAAVRKVEAAAVGNSTGDLSLDSTAPVTVAWAAESDVVAVASADQAELGGGCVDQGLPSWDVDALRLEAARVALDMKLRAV